MGLLNLIGVLSAPAALLDILKLALSASASDMGLKEKRQQGLLNGTEFNLTI